MMPRFAPRIGHRWLLLSPPILPYASSSSIHSDVPFDPLKRQPTNRLASVPLFTQGAILSGLRLSRYGTGTYSAFLITARCDLTHIRTDTLSFLPIIPIAEWVRYDGYIQILLARIITLEEKIRITSKELSPELQELIGSDWVDGFNVFVSQNSDVSKQLQDKLRVLISEYKRLKEIIATSTESPMALADAIKKDSLILSLINGATSRKVTDLLENKVMDVHFLPVIRPEESLSNGAGYVVLFRQVIGVPGRLVSYLLNGVSSLNGIPSELHVQAAANIGFPAGFISNVASPHVEHIMQRFSTVFVRIGVPDCSEHYKNGLVRKLTKEVSI